MKLTPDLDAALHQLFEHHRALETDLAALGAHLAAGQVQALRRQRAGLQRATVEAVLEANRHLLERRNQP